MSMVLYVYLSEGTNYILPFPIISKRGGSMHFVAILYERHGR